MNENPTPVLSPIVALLKSRKAMVALISAILNLIIPFVPGLEAHRADLLTISLILTPVIASVLIASIAHEDGKEKSAPAPGTTATATITDSGDVSATVSSPEGAPTTAETYTAPGHVANRRPLK